MATEEKKTKKKSGASWMVVTQEEEKLLAIHYAGKDRTKAREAVEEILGKKPVSVMRISRVSVFTAEDLEPRLAKKF